MNNNKGTDERVTHSSEEDKITSSPDKLLEMSSIDIVPAQMKKVPNHIIQEFGKYTLFVH